jgi:hypothetical protein
MQIQTSMQWIYIVFEHVSASIAYDYRSQRKILEDLECRFDNCQNCFIVLLCISLWFQIIIWGVIDADSSHRIFVPYWLFVSFHFKLFDKPTWQLKCCNSRCWPNCRTLLSWWFLHRSYLIATITILKAWEDKRIVSYAY